MLLTTSSRAVPGRRVDEALAPPLDCRDHHGVIAHAQHTLPRLCIPDLRATLFGRERVGSMAAQHKDAIIREADTLYQIGYSPGDIATPVTDSV